MTQEFFKGLSIVIGYFVACASCALLLRRAFPMPKEAFRKLLHMIVLLSLGMWLYAFQTWWLSALGALVFALLVLPVLALAERLEGYGELLIQRKPGEIKVSLMLVFGMFAAIIALCWGWIGDKLLAFACVFAWGFGDAAAALVGKRFGRHFLQGRLIEGRKSLEGTAAMFGAAFVAVLVILLIRGGLPWPALLTISAVAAAACAVVELYTLNGFDTVTCPFAAAAVILPLVWLWGGMGV